MNGRTIAWVLLGLILLAVVAGGVVSLYNAGVAQGLAQSGKLAVPAPGVAPYPYYGPYFFHPFGFGFGIFGLLFPLLFIFLIFALLRGIFWGGRWGRHQGGWGNGVPQRFEEWHRQAHESEPSTNK